MTIDDESYDFSPSVGQVGHISIPGPTGAGKSTVVYALVEKYRALYPDNAGAAYSEEDVRELGGEPYDAAIDEDGVDELPANDADAEGHEIERA